MPDRQVTRVIARVLLAVALLVPGSAWAATPGGAPAPSATSSVLDPGLPTSGDTAQAVIVQTLPGSDPAAAVRRVGGTPGDPLPLVGGVAATVPAAALPALAADPQVVGVTADREGTLLSGPGRSRVRWSLGGDGRVAPSLAETTGAAAAWRRGERGQGVGIAVLDTGVSPVRDLAGRVVHGPDLSGEGTGLDSYGHGTVMAGLAAGDGTESGGLYSGVAPEATVVSVKVAGRDGSVDVSTVLQAMHWVAAYADQYDIRVLNLSWGVPSTQDPAVDPLDHAVERLWRQGIVVVVGAGNAGPSRGAVTKPGTNPTVLTVGALDTRGDRDPANDVVPAWSGRGRVAGGAAKPDLVAPGRSLISTRAPDSRVEAENPDSLVAPSYVTGTGTSQATAVTSGLVALLVGARPDLTPDQVKKALTVSAVKVSGVQRESAGAGRVALDQALDRSGGSRQQQELRSTGLGSLEGARGGVHVEAECDGVRREITGEIDVRCQPWDPRAWVDSEWTGDAWTGSTWSGSTWSGSTWSGSTWSGSTWSGSTWSGSTWSGSTWSGSTWSGSTWSGSTWSTLDWDDAPHGVPTG